MDLDFTGYSRFAARHFLNCWHHLFLLQNGEFNCLIQLFNFSFCLKKKQAEVQYVLAQGDASSVQLPDEKSKTDNVSSSRAVIQKSQKSSENFNATFTSIFPCSRTCTY